MSERLVFRITPEGDLECLWYPELDSGEIDLTGLGEMTITRASQIEPVNDSDRIGWQILLADGTDLGIAPSRECALAVEIEYLEERLIAGKPLLVKG